MNLYWPIYKNLEKNLLELSQFIHFSDDQESVYSLYISDLLIRTAVEIEAISKELYKLTGGNMKPVDDSGKERTLYFDTDCIQHLDLKLENHKKGGKYCISCILLCEAGKFNIYAFEKLQ